MLELRAGALQDPTPPRLLTVIGVLPPDFEFPTGPSDFYTPLPLPESSVPSPRVTMIGRLAPGVSLEAATDELNAMGAAVRSPWPDHAPALTGPRFEIQRLKELAVMDLEPALGTLLAAVVAVHSSSAGTWPTCCLHEVPPDTARWRCDSRSAGAAGASFDKS